MNIMLVSQCSKQALPGTRRILDQFAERKGDRTWLTPITEAGLKTLHQLLRQRARRNTAVACHWIKGGEIELMWVVGNRRRFGTNGTVPTNYTGRDLLGSIKEDGWRHTESIALLAAIAGLFHDFGKANKLFQSKLKGERGNSEPIRHEWLSVRLFEAFVGSRSDSEWIAALHSIDASAGVQMISDALRDPKKSKSSPLRNLSDRPVAWTVAWLLLTHHRLPYPARQSGQAKASRIDRWQRELRPVWNSPQVEKYDNTHPEWQELWVFPDGLPTTSKTWRARAQSVASWALKHLALHEEDWLDETFVLHLARCSLMLADHYYSAQQPRAKWRDGSYVAYANTERHEEMDTRKLKQKLDEHNVGVSHHAYQIARSLPNLTDLLPAVGDVRPLRKPGKGRFVWQNKAYGLASQCRELSERQGGFLVNMASTGMGKTLANARMAYGLSRDKQGCRFNVLLGLRSLTLQTGDALRTRTRLGDDELAVLVGSAAERELYQKQLADTGEESSTGSGSESADDLFSPGEYIIYSGELAQTRVGKWLGQQKTQRSGTTLHSLLSAPVLVSTIDRLIPATESARGGHQIAPMLRLLSADTVLDEPDDFDLNDLPALCRLVHWIGLLGRRVILSSATLPPALIEALFDAYSAGRGEYNRVTLGANQPVCCGWVDEFGVKQGTHADIASFAQAHLAFCERRVENLKKHEIPQRLAVIVPLAADPKPATAYALTVRSSMLRLHNDHHQIAPNGHRVSIGLVRMANINPLVAVTKAFMSESPPPDYRVHVCVYHARHPLFRRSKMEAELDTVLARHDPAALWAHPAIAAALKHPETNQIFLVVATSVAEVGRDHDYDWAVVEPSSVRSISQLAGRVKRHRSGEAPDKPNIVLLQRNFRSLNEESTCFHRPGFESTTNTSLQMVSHELDKVLPESIYRHPNSAARVLESPERVPRENLADLEHEALRQKLFGDGAIPDEFSAQLWWREPVRWCYQLQNMTPFRSGIPQDLFAFVASEPDAPLSILQYNPVDGDWINQQGEFEQQTFQPADRVQTWGTRRDAELMSELAVDYPDLENACRRYMTVSLDRPSKGASPGRKWQYCEIMGLHR